MPKKPKQIKISDEAEKLLEEIRDKNRKFNLSTEVEDLIKKIHAEVVGTSK